MGILTAKIEEQKEEKRQRKVRELALTVDVHAQTLPSLTDS